jgi:hypothetical protein
VPLNPPNPPTPLPNPIRRLKPLKKKKNQSRRKKSIWEPEDFSETISDLL